ncbi:MaoC family dehydratase [Salinimicrobium sp. TH3]|uniref:MaoC family dehydratase n=1 Tax=Salinimicrobium sp. TH3 TaxID=2997342 RepID=UPI0022752186|nr:MaoC family dehydratase [Salinimicrobium sp. TH3]MCY2686956.1 MaoC family dehydratase [Salinimicrobium sp. TH3]
MDLKIGDKASLTKEFSEQDVKDFSVLSGDQNPIHFDEEYAKKSRFGRRIVQGPMVVSLIGGILGSQLPGPGTIYLSQETFFKKPVFLDQKLTAWVEVVNVRKDKPVVTLKSWVENDEGEVVVDGTSVILFLDT